MQGVSSLQSMLLAAIIGVAILGLWALLKSRKNPIFYKKLMPARSARHAYYQLDVRQLERIRTLLGLSVAKATLDFLAQQIEHVAATPISVLVGEMSLQVAVSQDADAPIDQTIDAILAALPQTIAVAGLTLTVNVKARLLFDLIDESNRTADRVRLTSGFLQSHDGVQVGRNIALIKEFSKALEHGTVTQAYQPKLDLRNNTIPSVEALLRWTREDGTEANILDLITLLEDTGSIGPLTFWALRKAIGDTTIMHQSGFPIRTYVNVSGSLLSSPDLADAIISAIGGHSDKVGIEITETAVIADPDQALHCLEVIAAAGISIAIDDFGAGVSSLEYLQRLPANELKIDRSFIAGLSSSHRNPLIVKATIDLAHALEMQVTAEGVEDQLSMALLRVMGCDMVQGYIVARAMPLADLLVFLERSASAAANPPAIAGIRRTTRPQAQPQNSANG